MRRLIRWITPEPDALGPVDGHLGPCPASPNCVSSEAAAGSHHVAPFALAAAPEVAWKLAREAVATCPGRSSCAKSLATFMPNARRR